MTRPRLPPRLTQAGAVLLLGAATLAAVVVLVFIIALVMRRGLPALSLEFLLTPSRDMGRQGGILQPLVGTLILPVIALAVALPLGVGTAIYLTEYTREGLLTRAIRFGTDCLAGVPSIIFGLFGFIFFVSILRWGWSVLSGGLTLAIMVLPTIIRTAEEAIRAVPRSYREVSVSLGGTRLQTVFRTVLPNALPGIVTGVMLSVGRAVGETAAVIYTAGSALNIPTSLFAPARTMAVHFYILAREGLSDANAYGTAAVLVFLVLAINLVTYWLMNRLIRRRSAVSVPDDPKVRVRGLSVFFRDRVALKGLDLDIPARRILGIIGPSGSGKTTFLRALNRMNELESGALTQGTVAVDGQDVYAPGYDAVALRKRVGMLFALPVPLPMSIFDNVAYGPRLAGVRGRAELQGMVEESLRAAFLWDEVADRLSQSALRLSGGQQQRMCLARTLGLDPELILLDEPCSGLDPISTARIEEALGVLKSLYTIVLVTNNTKQAGRVADDTAFFLMGELVELGSTTLLFTAPKDSRTNDYITGRFG